MVRHTGKDIIDVEGVAVALTSPFQSPGIFGPELDAPEPFGFVSNGDTALSQKIFYIAEAEVESIVEPNSVPDYVVWETMTMVYIHSRNVAEKSLFDSTVSIADTSVNSQDTC